MFLNGELSESFFEWAEEDGIELFIALRRVYGGVVFRDPNYNTDCNYYDFYDTASPSKHVLVLWFAFSQEIEHNPLILLKLHGINFCNPTC